MKAQIGITVDTEVLEVINNMNINKSEVVNEFFKSLIQEPLPEGISNESFMDEIKALTNKLNTLKIQQKILEQQQKDAETEKKRKLEEEFQKHFRVPKKVII